jgi:DNA-binding winged helix-turn-helix (wHTH) protein/tetratricopeptide (TPR) repeat protein
LSAPSRYRTGEFLIDLDAREIRHGERVVDLEAKAFDLIALLLAGRERALSKRELNQALWGNRPVTDAALSQQLRKARRALGDDGDAQAMIRTVHGRGLRWIAPVTLEAAPGETPPPSPPPATSVPVPAIAATPARDRRRRSWLMAAGFVVLLLAAAGLLLRHANRADGGAGALQRIAVLPVVDNTGESTLTWARAGLMGLMTSLFEQRGGIEVVPAQAVQAVVPPNASIDIAGVQPQRRKLGATHVVVAELRRVGPIYELDVHLVAAGGAERHETLHGSEPAALAADAVARVRRWLGLTPLPVTDPDASGTSSPFLAEAYARGLDAQLHGDAGDAKKYFSICLDHDPGLVWPRLGLATAQAQSGESAQSLDNASKVAAAARERNDVELLVPALRLLASLAFFRGDLDGAAVHLDEAIAQVSAQEHPLALVELLVAYGSIDDERGDAAQSRRHFEQALKLARDSDNRRGEASVLVNLASLDNEAGDAVAAAASLRAGLDAARSAGDVRLEAATLGNLGATEANQGRLLTAIALLKQTIALARERKDRNLQMLATAQLVWALLPFDRTTDAHDLAAQMLAIGEREQNVYWQAEAHWVLAGLAAHRHDGAQAFADFDRARTLYASAGMNRNVAQVLAETVDAAAELGDAARARTAAEAFRALTPDGAEAAAWRERLPLIDAELRALGGDVAGASADLGRALDALRGAPGPAAQAMLFQLGRWQLKLDRGADLLARPEWTPWLAQHPDAIALHVAALRSAGRGEEADAEQRRLDALRQSPEIALDPSWLAAF